MVIGLLMLAAIPTVTGVAEGIAEKDKKIDPKREEQLLRKFNLSCWCEGKSKGKSDVHRGRVVLGEGKVWVQSPKIQPSQTFFPFEGFYVSYPDDQRPVPAPMGMVTMVSDNPPLMNWIYVDRTTSELKHGNRTKSRPHRVGDWSFTNDDDDSDDDDDDAGGVDFNGEEKFVVVEPKVGDNEGRWEVWWDERDDKLAGVSNVEGRLVLRVSLERTFITNK